MQDNTLEVHQEIFIAQTPNQMWDFFLNQDGFKQWFNAKEFVIDVIEGGKLKFAITRDGKLYHITGETGLLHSNKKLVFTWSEQNQWGQMWFAPTNVSFEMLADKGGTQFKVIHNGFKYLPEGTQEEICQQYKDYWASNALPHLKTLVENSWLNGRYHDYRYHHILDPRTGYSAPALASATIVAPSAMLADGLATAVMTMTPQAGLKFIEKIVNCEACLITKETKILQTTGFQLHTWPKQVRNSQPKERKGAKDAKK